MRRRGPFASRVPVGRRPVIWGVSGAGAAAASMLAIAPVSCSLTAQEVGDRVRVFVAGTTTIGEVTALSDEGFELIGQGRRQSSFKYGRIYRLERSLGARHAWKRGLAYGAAGGVALGLLLGVFQAGACEWLTAGLLDGECAGHGLQVAVVAGVNMGVAGGVLGTAVGALIRRESWTPIPIAGRRLTSRPMVGPIGRRGAGGAVLGGRLGF